ncbi:transposable element Tc3 transposase [Caerostris darwini]|uniref:Transposable element Tc3 transposase n=1 Tax=Caerostris darwini TaxID=1538125 RepID=A0AAV4X8H1_9ARAC|nr:transposable element Tc3 transposase [Caerostris darwini]
MSSRAIAIKIGRSKTVVNNFLKLKDNYGKKNTGGRSKALSSRDETRVCQLASTGKYSTRKLIPTTDTEHRIVKDENNETAFAALMQKQQVVESPPFTDADFDFGLDSSSDEE